MIADIDLFVRLITIGAGLMLLAQIVVGEARTAIKLPLVAMTAGAIAYVINVSPVLNPNRTFDPWIDLAAISVPFWIWLFARNLFEREPDRRVAVAAAGGLLISWFLGSFISATDHLAFYTQHLIGLALIVDLMRIAIFERKDDLIEKRRMIRLWLPLLVAAQAGGVIIFEMIEVAEGDLRRFAIIHLFNSLLILMIMLIAGLALLRTDPELLIKSQDDPVEDDAPKGLTPSETVLYAKLTNAMAEGVYRQPGLTIVALASQLGTPEHRLRALINRRLGHRNFSSFLNRHRIAEARAKLSDRAAVDLPVLTIAMDLGYNSLPTFNRAFRSETGTTPSDFRRAAIGVSSAATPVPEAEAAQPLRQVGKQN